MLAMAFGAFLSLLAMDVIEENVGFWPTLQALVIQLIPTLVLMVVLVLGWSREWIGAVLYSAMEFSISSGS